MKFEFKTEWLSQISLLAKCGTYMDVESFCKGLEHIVIGDVQDFEVTDMAALVLDPISQEIRKQAELRERRAAAGRKGGNPLLNHSLTNAKAEHNHSLSNGYAKKEIKEKEKKQKKENTEKEVYASSVDNTCSNNSSVLSPSDACAEPKIDSAPEAPPLVSIILNDGTEFAVTQDIYDRLARTYPAVDTMQQLREIENWCFSNPKNRKTRNGVMRFINSWFSREQDKGLVPKYRQRNQPQPRLTAEEIYNLPAISPWETGG